VVQRRVGSGPRSRWGVDCAGNVPRAGAATPVIAEILFFSRQRAWAFWLGSWAFRRGRASLPRRRTFLSFAPFAYILRAGRCRGRQHGGSESSFSPAPDRWVAGGDISGNLALVVFRGRKNGRFEFRSRRGYFRLQRTGLGTVVWFRNELGTNLEGGGPEIVPQFARWMPRTTADRLYAFFE